MSEKYEALIGAMSRGLPGQIRLNCGHWYTHRIPPSTAAALRSAPDTVIGVGIKPPERCPDCAAPERVGGEQ